MEAAAEVILEFLQSKCLLSAERALRTELELVLQREDALLARNLWTSRLEELLNTELPRRVESEPPEIEDLTPLEAVASQLDPGEGNLAAGTLPHARERVERARQAAGAERRKRLTLFELVPLGADESARLQRQRGHGSAATRVVFRDGVVLSEASLDAVCSWPQPRGLRKCTICTLAKEMGMSGVYLRAVMVSICCDGCKLLSGCGKAHA